MSKNIAMRYENKSKTKRPLSNKEWYTFLDYIGERINNRRINNLDLPGGIKQNLDEIEYVSGKFGDLDD